MSWCLHPAESWVCTSSIACGVEITKPVQKGILANSQHCCAHSHDHVTWQAFVENLLLDDVLGPSGFPVEHWMVDHLD